MEDDDMAKHPGLIERNGVWWVRKRIPVDLEHIDKRGSIRVSLGTKDRREAVGKYHLKMAEFEAGFDQLRKELRSRPAVEVALTTGRIEDLGKGALEGLVTSWWSGREEIRQPQGWAGQSRDVALAQLDAEKALFRRAEAEGRDVVSEIADRLLVDAGARSRPHHIGKIKTHVQYPTLDRTSLAYAQLQNLIRQGLGYEDTMARDFVTGERNSPSHPIFNPQGNAAAHSKTIGDLVHNYRIERERVKGAESTARKYRLLFRVIEEQWDQGLPAAEINREMCVGLITFLQSLPVNGTKIFPKMTLAQSVAAADASNRKRLAPNTVRSYVQNLFAVLRWGKQQGYGVYVVTDGLKPAKEEMVQRRGMSENELETMFRALSTHRNREPHKFWVPALAAYTGARAEELCQLLVEDVHDVGDIMCLNLTRFDQSGRVVEDKKFKNKQSERYVPLHDEVLAAGFMTYVETCDPAGHLFPALKPGAKGNRSHNFSKWYGRFMDSIGLSDPSLVFHSYRHGFRDACRDADIPDEVAHALGGWATINQGQKYGNRGKVPNLHRALKKIGYGEFSLSMVTPAK